ncbi:PREDICTED: F-box protein At4g22280-like [Camelina sativa]|uniref:F-box protein At4g22280-like n=1 Tax=Camelina sativa TaxID=90675 RepID=A0ABM1R6P0_CAMSA|nr:PREDICTED: F-box protein At4g22280-like [Camelina sativa]
MDRINGLSDDIICHILSFLQIKESALTSILSKRWRNLFAFTPNLHFDNCEVGSGQSFIDLIDRLLVVSGKFPLRKISIKCRKSIINLEVSDHVTRWMALNRGTPYIMVKNHKNHDIDIITSREVILVPLEIFTSKTMVELKLGKLFYAMSPEVVYLPSLKTLYLDTVYFHSNFSSEELLTACPVLEDLTICDGIWQNGECCRTMSSSTFKKLTIKSIRFNNSVMSFDTPSLAYLEYTDVVPRDYPIVNLESLVEAKLDLYRPRFDISNPTNLIKGLRNVEVLEISSIRTSEMLYHFREAIPVFSNMIRLTITTHFYSYHWKYLPILVRKTPNLHTLIIKV